MLFKLTFLFLFVFCTVFSTVVPLSTEDEKHQNHDDRVRSLESSSSNGEINTELFSGNDAHEFQSRVRRAASTLTPSANLSKSNDTIRESASVSVVCSGNSSDFKWTNPKGKEIKEKSLLNNRVYLEKKSKPAKNSSTLVIKEATESDAGTYYCVNKVGTLSSSSAAFKLTVLPKPKPKLSPKGDKVLEEGENYNVTCSGNWNNVTWKNSNGVAAFTYRGGLNPVFAEPNPKANSSTLVFRNATKAHQDYYYCTVNVQGEEKQEKVKIIVKPIELTFSVDTKPSISSDDVNKGNAEFTENRSYNVSCGGAARNLMWTYEGQAVSQVRNSKNKPYVLAPTMVDNRKMVTTMRFEEVLKENKGQYACTGYSSFNGAKLEKILKLKVKEDTSEPEFSSLNNKIPIRSNKVSLEVKMNYAVECIGSATDIKWFGPDEKVINEQTALNQVAYVTRSADRRLTLTFNQIGIANEGQYTCQVTRGIQTQKKTLFVEVIERAYFINGTQQSVIQVNKTENATLECSVGGHPTPMVSWKFDNNTMIQDDPRRKYNGTSLIIRNATRDDTGKYICTAKQSTVSGFTIEKAVELDVLHEPWVPESYRNGTEYRVLKTTAVLGCHCSASPAANYTWFRYGSILRTSSGRLAANLTEETVEIPFSRNEDVGMYVCRASNKFGFAEMNITVLPMKLPANPKVTAVSASKSQISVQISTTPPDGTIKKYEINFKESSAAKWSSYNCSVAPDVLTPNCTVSDLKKKTEYTLKARGLNELGFGNFSSEIKYSTSHGIRLCFSVASWFSVFAVIFLNTYVF